MLSIIICSISVERLQALRQNIEETIGVDTDFEIIAVDNSEKCWPLAKVYNYAAQRAKYDYLFFVHEDVKFHSRGWGAFIEVKLAEPDCGVIGFAGSKVRVKSYCGWGQWLSWSRSCYYQRSGDCIGLEFVGVSWDHPFDEVVTLDGFAMFVRKAVWEQNVFDEEMLTGFHCYDLDFTLQIARNYKNYVCCSSLVLIEHFSLGSYNTQWFADTIKLHRLKWNHFLPLMATDTHISKAELKKGEERSFYVFLFKMLRSAAVNKGSILLEFWSLPLSWVHFRHCLSCTLKYFRTLQKPNASR